MAIDPNDPLPLYHQIAEAIREQIACGTLRIGDSLEPMRGAAKRFGVNLHTVRHAYLALSRDGLIEMLGARGTRVISNAIPAGPARDSGATLTTFIREVQQQAWMRFGLTTTRLADEFARAEAHELEPPTSISIVECNAWQCRQHVDELVTQWDLEALPHPLTEYRAPTTDIVLATWFHYNDVRRRWPDLLHRIEFLTIRPDLTALMELDARTWWIVERDEATVGAVAGDLRAQLGEGSPEILPRITTDSAAALQDLPGTDPILFAPRVFSELDPSEREHERAFELRYVFDTSELSALAARLQWRPRGKTPSIT